MNKSIKNLMFLALLFILSSPNNFSQSSLFKVHSENYLYIKFVSETVGWLVSEDHIKKTTDAGKTWEIKLTLNKDIYFTEYIKNNGADFLNSNSGHFVLFTRTNLKFFLFKTNDGGNSWEQRLITGANVGTNDVSHTTFLNENYGWARNNSTSMIRTTNGGVSWELLSSNLGNIYKITFIDQLTGYYYTTSGLFKTIDGGYTWNQLTITGANNIWDFSVIGSKIWAASNGVYYSSDAGTTWSKISSDISFGNVSSLKMIDEIYGVADGYFTTNGGNSWTQKFNKTKMVCGFNHNNIWYFDQYRNLIKAEYSFDSTKVICPAMEFTDVVIVNDMVIIASSDNGALIRSEDGGKTWASIKDLYGYHVYDLCFAEGSNGIAVGYFEQSGQAYHMGFIAVTNDAGATWQITLNNTGSPFADYIYSAAFSNGVYLVKNLGNIIKSTNLGQTWSIDSTDYSGGSFFKMDFIGNTGFGIPFTGNQKLMKTTNGGTGWFQTAETNASSIYFLSQDLIWANFGWGENYKSSTGGASWVNADLDFQNIYFQNSLLGAAYGYLDNNNINTQGFYLTQDGGNSWQKLISGGTQFTRHAIDFSSSTVGFLADQNNLFSTKKYGLVDSIVTNVQFDIAEIPSEFKLFQNYPNPFNPSTEISFQVLEETQVSIYIYDLLGNEIAEVLNELKKPGSYKVNFNSAQYNLTSGIYFYKMTAGKKNQTQKMILLK